MSEQQEIIRARVRRLKAATGKSYSKLATENGLAASTLTRFMNSKKATHTLNSTTLRKLNALSEVSVHHQACQTDHKLLADVGRRMALVRSIVAKNTSDEDVAALFGWSVSQMEAVFSGKDAPTLSALWAFATRMGITTDFLLFEKLEGLPRSVERLLLAANPDLGLPPDHKGPGRDTDQA